MPPSIMMQQVGDVLEVSSLPSQSMHMAVSLRGGQAPRYLFQTNHDAIIFQTTLLQVANMTVISTIAFSPCPCVGLLRHTPPDHRATMLLILSC